MLFRSKGIDRVLVALATTDPADAIRHAKKWSWFGRRGRRQKRKSDYFPKPQILDPENTLRAFENRFVFSLVPNNITAEPWLANFTDQERLCICLSEFVAHYTANGHLERFIIDGSPRGLYPLVHACLREVYGIRVGKDIILAEKDADGAYKVVNDAAHVAKALHYLQRGMDYLKPGSNSIKDSHLARCLIEPQPERYRDLVHSLRKGR